MISHDRYASRIWKARTAVMISMDSGSGPRHGTSDACFVAAYSVRHKRHGHKYYCPRALFSFSLSCSKSRPQDRTSGWRKNGRLLLKNGCRDAVPPDRSYSNAGPGSQRSDPNPGHFGHLDRPSRNDPNLRNIFYQNRAKPDNQPLIPLTKRASGVNWSSYS